MGGRRAGYFNLAETLYEGAAVDEVTTPRKIMKGLEAYKKRCEGSRSFGGFPRWGVYARVLRWDRTALYCTSTDPCRAVKLCAIRGPPYKVPGT